MGQTDPTVAFKMVETFHKLRSTAGPLNPVVYTDCGGPDALVSVLLRGEKLGFRSSVKECHNGYLVLEREGGAEYAFGAFGNLTNTAAFGVFFLMEPGDQIGRAHRMLVTGLDSLLFLDVLNLSAESMPESVDSIAKAGAGFPLWL